MHVELLALSYLRFSWVTSVQYIAIECVGVAFWSVRHCCHLCQEDAVKRPIGNNNTLALQLDIQRTGVEDIYIVPRLSASDVPDKNYTIIMPDAVFVLS